MKRTKNILKITYLGILFIALSLYIYGDILELDYPTLYIEENDTLNVAIQMIMIMLTLTVIPLSLKLFHFHYVSARLQSGGSEALLKWGLLRMLMLGTLLITNAMLYYLFAFTAAFGYLAVVLGLSMMFIYPSTERCKTEIEA